MKYFYEKPERWLGAGEIYSCDHPLFSKCTLFKDGILGLIVVQEHYDKKLKVRWWGAVDQWLAGELYFHEGFDEFFKINADYCDKNGLYPVFTIRKIMWALRMKPLQKEFWETNTPS